MHFKHMPVITGGTLAFVVTIAFMALFGSIGHSLILYFTLVLGSYYWTVLNSDVLFVVTLISKTNNYLKLILFIFTICSEFDFNKNSS